MASKREYWIDVMRVFACVMVLFCHAPADGQANSLVGTAYSMVNAYLGMALGPVLFFMITGACIFNLKEGESVAQYFKRRFSRVLFPTLAWSVVYILMQRYVWNVEVVGDSSLWHSLIMMFFLPQYGLLWYMYALISIYLLAPIFSIWLKACSRRDLELFLLIWSITLLIPYIKVYEPEISGITNSNGMLRYMSSWLWLAVLGYYCRIYFKIEKVRWWHFVLVFSVAPLSILAFKLVSGETMTNCLSLASVFTTAGVFVLIQNIKYKETLKKPVELISKLSFGIYLSHMLFTHPFRIWISQFELASYIQIPVTVVFSGICAFVLVYLISKLPFGKYIIG